jgi:hypothetical protein
LPRIKKNGTILPIPKNRSLMATIRKDQRIGEIAKN